MAGRDLGSPAVSPAPWEAQECCGRRDREDAHLGLSSGTGGPHQEGAACQAAKGPVTGHSHGIKSVPVSPARHTAFSAHAERPKTDHQPSVLRRTHGSPGFRPPPDLVLEKVARSLLRLSFLSPAGEPESQPCPQGARLPGACIPSRLGSTMRREDSLLVNVLVSRSPRGRAWWLGFVAGGEEKLTGP